MGRISHHLKGKDYKKTHQRKLDEQRALYLEKREKEIQEEKQKKNIEEAAKPFKSDWRSTLTESEWYAIAGSGPTNSVSQTFAYGDPASGIEVTLSGLGGVEAHPSTVTIDGETYDAPTYNQLAMQGYAKPLGGGVQRKTDMEDVNSKLDSSQTFAQNVGADYMMNARVSSTQPQKSFMDAYLEVQEKWAKIIDPLQYEFQTQYVGQTGPKDLADKINSLIAKQDAELEALTKKYASGESSPGETQISVDDENFITSLEGLPKGVNNIMSGWGFAGDMALRYAKGDYTPITKSPGYNFDERVLALIKRSSTPGAVQDGTYTDNLPSGPLGAPQAIADLPVRLSLGQFNYDITPDGIRIRDTFNFNANRSIGALSSLGLGIGQSLQNTANRLVDIGNKRARALGFDPDDDNFGIKIDYIIPKSRLSKRQRKELYRESTIWNRTKKHLKGA